MRLHAEWRCSEFPGRGGRPDRQSTAPTTALPLVRANFVNVLAIKTAFAGRRANHCKRCPNGAFCAPSSERGRGEWMPRATGVRHPSRTCDRGTRELLLSQSRALFPHRGIRMRPTKMASMPSTKRPSRSCRSANEAPCSFSTIRDLGHELLELLSPVHSRETSLSSITTSLSASCHSPRLTDLQWHFSVPLDQRARQSPRSIVGQVGASVAQLGLSCRGRGFVLCGSRSLLGAKKHRTAAGFRVVVSVASHLTAQFPIVGPARAIASVALPASSRRVCASVISRIAPAGGCLVVVKNKVRFLLLCCTRFFLLPPFGATFYTHGSCNALSINETSKTAHFKNGGIVSILI